MPAGLVVFDLDGTLLDTLRDLADSMNAVLARRGFPVHPVDAYRYFVGDGVTNLVRRALPPDRVQEETVRGCVQEMGVEYSRRWAGSTAPYSGVQEMLRGLGELEIEMAVLSNKPHELTVAVVRHYFPATRFSSVLGARDGVRRKPDPAAVFEILEAAGVEAASALYVGDTATDMRTAQAAGVPAVGVLWGFRKRSELEEAGAAWIVDEPSQVLPIAASR